MPRLLFVEDEKNLRLLVSEALGDLGHEVARARDGAEAIELLPGPDRF